MPVTNLSPPQFFEESRALPVFDVRTPAEYTQGHLPGSLNLPLFTNEERAVVGTIYKQKGREEAILKGLEFIGPRMRGIIEEVLRRTDSRKILVHCWRGGMRSGSVAWLLNLYGFEVSVLRGGYKAWRRLALDSFSLPRRVRILGGHTGSGKTEILHVLAARGEQIIDLEGLARHKGSAFGSLGEEAPPTQEQFENNLAALWLTADPERTLWLEDENRTIGRIYIPEGVWGQMGLAPVLFLDIPLDRRAAYLTNLYGKYPIEALRASVEKIRKRLGPLATTQALAALDEGRLEETARLTLFYYDRAYAHGLSKRAPETVATLLPRGRTAEEVAGEVIQLRMNNFDH